MSRVLLYMVILFCTVCSAVQSGLAAGNVIDQIRDDLRSRIKKGSESQYFTCRGELICGSWAIPLFYEARNYQPVWYTGKGLIPQARFLIEAIQAADLEGLRPDDYHLVKLEHLLAQVVKHQCSPVLADPETLGDFDLLLTDAFLIYSSNMLAGRVNPETIHPEWIALDRTEDLFGILLAGIRSEAFDKIVAGLSPPHAGYRNLRESLHEYRKIAAKGGWPEFAAGPSIQVGDRDERVVSLKKHGVRS